MKSQRQMMVVNSCGQALAEDGLTKKSEGAHLPAERYASQEQSFGNGS